MTDQTFNVPQVEAALCIWEWMLDARDDNEGAIVATARGDAWLPGFRQLWEQVGSSQMRMLAWELAPGVEALYQSLCAEVGEDELRDVYCAYDWEFIPAVCMSLDWSKGGSMMQACYQIGPVELPVDVRAAVLAEYEEGKVRNLAARTAAAQRLSDFAGYTDRCRRAAGRIWGYPGLVDDDPNRVKLAFEAGYSPDEWAQAEGDGLELSEPDPMTAQSLAVTYAEP